MNNILLAKGKKVLCAVTTIVMILVAFAPLASYATTDSPRIVVSQVFTTSDGAFTYRLKPLETGNPMPAGSTAEGFTFAITGTKSVAIKLPAYGEAGVYRYKLFQVIGTEKPGYTYDKRVYTIEAHVNEKLGVDIIVLNQDGKKAGDIEFENSRTAVPSDPGKTFDTPVKKTVSGNPSYTTTFEFRLEAQNASQPMPAGSAGGTKTVKITGSGESKFGTWSYKEEGTYYYTVYEVNTGAGGYTYDTTVYTITDTVKEKDGKLVVSRVVTNDYNKPVQAFAFINKFREGKEGPKTGDDFNIALYSTLFAVSGALAAGAVIFLVGGGRKRRKESAKEAPH